MASLTPEARLARIEAELEAITRTVETFGPTARQALETDLRTQELGRKLDDFQGWLGDVEDRLAERIGDVAAQVKAIRGELQAHDAARASSRTSIVVAAIAGSATVLTGLAGAAAIILGGS